MAHIATCTDTTNDRVNKAVISKKKKYRIVHNYGNCSDSSAQSDKGSLDITGINHTSNSF